jgi:hypothetical protein
VPYATQDFIVSARRSRLTAIARQIAPRKLELLLAARRVAELARRDVDLERE